MKRLVLALSAAVLFNSPAFAAEPEICVVPFISNPNMIMAALESDQADIFAALSPTGEFMNLHIDGAKLERIDMRHGFATLSRGTFPALVLKLTMNCDTGDIEVTEN